MTNDPTQRTRELLSRLAKSSPDQIARIEALEGSVRVVLGRDAGSKRNGQLGLFTIVNILARLSPVVTAVDVRLEADFPVLVRAPLFGGYSMIPAIQQFAWNLNSPVTIRVGLLLNKPGHTAVSVAVGAAPNRVDLSFGNDGWNVQLETDGAALVTDNFNPVGSMAAACLGASECFKRLMLLKGREVGMPDDFLSKIKPVTTGCVFSCLTYGAAGAHTPNPILPESIDLGHLCVVGVGAGGGACVYTLSTMDLIGRLTMVDSDIVNSVNLNRYLYALLQDVAMRRPKVEVLAGLVGDRPALRIDVHRKPFLDFKSGGEVQAANIVLSTVDSVDARHAIQWETPRLILDAAVSTSSFYVHRVQLGVSACLRCTHAPNETQGDVIELVAGQLNLPPDLLRQLYADNAPLPGHLLEVARPKAKELGIHLPSQEMTVKDWIAVHCGEFDLRESADVIVPVPFATVLPGILLAGEVIKERHFRDSVLQHRVNHDTFGEPSRWLQTLLFPKPACPLCGDESVRRSYASRYNNEV